MLSQVLDLICRQFSPRSSVPSHAHLSLTSPTLKEINQQISAIKLHVFLLITILASIFIIIVFKFCSAENLYHQENCSKQHNLDI